MKKTGVVASSLLLTFGLSLPMVANLTNTNTQAFADPSTQEQADAALSKLNSLQQEMGQAENNYNQAILDKEEAQAKVDEAQSRIDECNERISGLQVQLGNRARSMYRTGSSSLLDLILGATSFTEFATNWGILTTLNENDQSLVAESKSLREEVTEQKKTLDEQKKVAEDKEAEANRTYAEAQQLVSTQQAVYDNLSEQAKAELEAAQEAQYAQVDTISDSSNSSGGGNNSGGNNVNNDKQQTVTGNTILDRAYANLGKPYAFGGGGPDAFDCSGFVGYCVTGRYGHALGSTGSIMGLTQVTDPQPGDICVSYGHAAIYLGGGQIIHAANPSTGVLISGINSSWMNGSYIFVRY